MGRRGYAARRREMRISLLAGSIAAIVTVFAATAFPAGAAPTSKTIRVVERATTDAVTDTGKKGTRPATC
jgi:hypothetical protein